MKQFLRDYFTFNRRERNGVFILLFIILLLILYLSFSDLFFTKEKTDFSKFEKEIAEFETEQKRISDSLSARNNYFTSSPALVLRTNTIETDSEERFPFNPNNLPDEDWLRLGLSEKQIKVIKNYESKGGKFRTKEDVKKMYCITPELYASLEAYIQILDETTESKKKNETQTPLSSRRGGVGEAIELNSADTTELKKLKGIGTAFAKRIIKYRDLIGGFAKKEQLLEVYGFDREKFDLITPNITIDPSGIKKININSASVETLKKHPYIDKKSATNIYWHRINHGNYSDVQQILKTNLVDEELYSKIAPYLAIE